MMISEVDLRDWDRVDFDVARVAAENLYDFEKPYMSYDALIRFIDSVEELRDSQIKTLNKHVPAILRKGEE